VQGRQEIPRLAPGTLLNQCRLHKTKDHLTPLRHRRRAENDKVTHTRSLRQPCTPLRGSKGRGLPRGGGSGAQRGRGVMGQEGPSGERVEEPSGRVGWTAAGTGYGIRASPYL